MSCVTIAKCSLETTNVPGLMIRSSGASASTSPRPVSAARAALTGRGEVEALAPEDRIMSPGTFVVSREHLAIVTQDIQSRVDGYHHANPLRRGIQREELRRGLDYAQRPFDAII